jgi:hypothetical protein
MWLFLDSTVAWSFFMYGRDRVCSMPRPASHLIRSVLMNSLPSSESNTLTGMGNASMSTPMAAPMLTNALLWVLRLSVYPVFMSVMVRVRAHSPRSVGPQCTTVSASTMPGIVYHRFVLCVVITGIGQSDCLI